MIGRETKAPGRHFHRRSLITCHVLKDWPLWWEAAANRSNYGTTYVTSLTHVVNTLSVYALMFSVLHGDYVSSGVYATGVSLLNKILWPLVRKRNILTERPSLVVEI
jgi:hypothetical protein